MKIKFAVTLFITLCLFLISPLFAHGVDSSTKQFLLSNDGVALIPFIYIGAKHMITGYDHLLFLVGVIFYLNNFKDILKFITVLRQEIKIPASTTELNKLDFGEYMEKICAETNGHVLYLSSKI